MATLSSVLAWRIPWMGEPGGLPSMGLHRVGHDWRDLAVAAFFLMIFLLVSAFKYLYPVPAPLHIVQSLSCVQLFTTHGLQHARLPCPPLHGNHTKFVSSFLSLLVVIPALGEFVFLWVLWETSRAFPRRIQTLPLLPGTSSLSLWVGVNLSPQEEKFQWKHSVDWRKSWLNQGILKEKKK